MRILYVTAAIFFFLLSQGCSGTRPSTFYILSPISRLQESENIESNTQHIGILLGPVSIPEFLDRPQIVTRSSENILELAEFHRWGGSFQNNILGILGENLSILLDSDRILLFRQQPLFPVDFRVILDVRQFDGELGSTVVLSVHWMVADQRGNRKFLVRKSLFREQTSGPGYEAFVSAQSRAVGALSQEIADAITDIVENHSQISSPSKDVSDSKKD